jgi:hypothetical protein
MGLVWFPISIVKLTVVPTPTFDFSLISPLSASTYLFANSESDSDSSACSDHK